jgi:hypothetical protein
MTELIESGWVCGKQAAFAESAHLKWPFGGKIWISANIKQALHAKSTLPVLQPAISPPNQAARGQKQRHSILRIKHCISMCVQRVDD